jgi:UDP-N-acetyl-2-amino-2-deoxyglucuronate dehydrogenase
MFVSIFTDELGVDLAEALPVIKSWNLGYGDLRGRVFGKAFESLTPEQFHDVRKLFDSHGMKVGCLQSSLAKVHLPDKERQRAEAEKLESIIRAADILDCRLVRAFHFWQPPKDLSGELAVRPDEQQKVLELFAPLAERARAAGLILAFENCGVTPDEVFTVLDGLRIPNWGLAWDVSNNWACDERRRDETAYIQRMAVRSKLVHVKALRAVPGYGDETIPYGAVLNACHHAGMPGPVSAETHNPDRASVSNTDMSRRVVEVIHKAWPSAAPGGVFDEERSTQGVKRPWHDNPVGFVVVGLGMGHNRSVAITKTSGTRLIGVCDIREERAKRTAEECKVPYTTDLRPWLDRKDVEVVAVLTETGRHGEVALQALAAGKHVIVTKPMDATLAACDAMIRAAEERRLLLAVDFEMRYRKELNSLKASVEQGRLGRLLSATSSLKILRKMEYFQSDGGWRGTRRWDGGGVLSNQSIHHIDEIAFTVGIPARVRCTIWTQNHEIEAEDLGSAVWEYANGLAVTFSATTNYPQPTWYASTELSGTQGSFFSARGGPFERPVARWYLEGAWTDAAPEHAESEWLNSWDNMAAAIRTGAKLVCSGREGRRTQSILDAMYRSAYEAGGGWVTVSPDHGG